MDEKSPEDVLEQMSECRRCYVIAATETPVCQHRKKGGTSTHVAKELAKYGTSQSPEKHALDLTASGVFHTYTMVLVCELCGAVFYREVLRKAYLGDRTLRHIRLARPLDAELRHARATVCRPYHGRE